MKGFAIAVEFLEWENAGGLDHTEFKKLQSHYVGSFSRAVAADVYDRLSAILDQEVSQQRAERAPSKD